MKNLMLTTALVAATSFGVANAQTAATENGAEMTQAGAVVPAFLVSDFTGKNLYTLDTDTTRTLNETRMSDGVSPQDRARMRWESDEAFVASRDAWDNVGNIDDVVLTQDGELRGVIIDVGGFLGLGARSVMIDLDDLYFVTDETNPEDMDDFFVVATMTQEQLENLPEWDPETLNTGFQQRGYDSAAAPATNTGAGMDDTAAMNNTNDAFEGYAPIPAAEMTAERVLGADVYGAEGENIANIDDLVLDADGAITHAVMDVGGFLGLGSYTIALEIDDVDVMWNPEDESVRARVSMTQEQLEAMPEYEG
ncbi:MAG: PRC-barrel domain-containing protein [Loktanella sp.]|nr:PRC-barrel domain-containing protein [Loktanella sp.]